METAKGFRDIENASKRTAIRNIIENIFQLYNFQAVETPIIEYEEFVKGENQNDEAISDIFKLQDKGKRDLALRYEFTFQLKRLSKNKKLPYKRYQIGPVFRDEPIAGNRWRQFTQCDADIVGSTIKNEAEILDLIVKILTELKVKFTININNRKLLRDTIILLTGLDEKDTNELLIYLDKLDKKNLEEIEKDKKKSFALKKIQKIQMKNLFLPLVNTLKNLNLEELKNYYLGILKNRGKEKDYENSLFKQGYEEIKLLEEYCKIYKIKTNFVGYLARGLSYYNGTIFEVKSDIKETIAAGGSYMINGVQATGISFGLDRLELLSPVSCDSKKILLISLNQDKKSIEIASKIRKLSIPCEIFYGKPTKALDYANSELINYVIFIGEEEVKKKKYKIKNMASGKENLVDEKNLEKFLGRIR